MPITGSPKKPKKSAPAPEEMDAEGVDYGDGVLIPPMTDSPFGPGASAAGGPSVPQDDIRSDIFRSLYRQGKRMAGPTNIFGGFGPPPAPDPLAGFGQPPAPEEPPFFLSASPTPAPVINQPPSPRLPGPNAPIRRFPRASSLMAGARGQQPPLGRGY